MYGKRKYCYPFINKIFRTSFRLFFLFSILFEIFIHNKGLYRIIHVLTCTKYIYKIYRTYFNPFPIFYSLKYSSILRDCIVLYMYDKWKYGYPFINKIFRTCTFQFFPLFYYSLKLIRIVSESYSDPRHSIIVN